MPEAVDGFVSLLGGMQGGIAPELIKEDNYARGLNVSSRAGLIHTRPRIVVEASLPSSNAYQGGEVWALPTGYRLVFVLSGKLWSVDIATWSFLDHGNVFDDSARCFFCQVDRYMVVQDGINPAQVLDCASGTPTLITHDIPVGTIMAYAHGRLHLVPKLVPGTTESGARSFISGDICLPNDPANVLQFTETTYWNEGGAHGLPEELGEIHGIKAFRNAASGTGVGGLVILAENGSSAFDLSLPRSKWNSTNLAQVLFYGIGTGTLSPFSTISVNDDVVYRSLDGIRFVRYSKTELGGSSGALSCTPSSNEVTPFIITENFDSLPNVTSALADNRMFMTAGGKWVVSNDVFTSMIVMDMAAVYGLRGAPTPVYDGIWTGVNPRQLFTVVEDYNQKLLIVSENNKIYSLSDSIYLDEGDHYPLCRVYTKVMYFPSDRVSLKELLYAELWVSGIHHNVDVTIHYRPEGFPLWSKLGEGTIQSAGSSYAQRRRKLRIALSDDAKTYDPETKDALFRGTGFQFCIEWRGHMQIDTARFAVNMPIPETPNLACAETELSDKLEASSTIYELDDYTYDIEA